MRLLKKVNHLVVHCAATKSNQDVTIADLYQWHVKDNGWSDIGYHYFVKFDGSVHPCRDVTYQGAHCKAVNDKSIGICLEGGYGGVNNFTEAQLDALWELLCDLKQKHPNACVNGHSHFDDKACPSFQVTQWYESMLENKGLYL
jgi:N-acetyl-anhydromuramyl-L-alanine amidase AmpD